MKKWKTIGLDWSNTDDKRLKGGVERVRRQGEMDCHVLPLLPCSQGQ